MRTVLNTGNILPMRITRRRERQPRLTVLCLYHCSTCLLNLPSYWLTDLLSCLRKYLITNATTTTIIPKLLILNPFSECHAFLRRRAVAGVAAGGSSPCHGWLSGVSLALQFSKKYVYYLGNWSPKVLQGCTEIWAVFKGFTKFRRIFRISLGCMAIMAFNL